MEPSLEQHHVTSPNSCRILDGQALKEWRALQTGHGLTSSPSSATPKRRDPRSVSFSDTIELEVLSAVCSSVCESHASDPEGFESKGRHVRSDEDQAAATRATHFTLHDPPAAVNRLKTPAESTLNSFFYKGYVPRSSSSTANVYSTTERKLPSQAAARFGMIRRSSSSNMADQRPRMQSDSGTDSELDDSHSSATDVNSRSSVHLQACSERRGGSVLSGRPSTGCAVEGGSSTFHHLTALERLMQEVMEDPDISSRPCPSLLLRHDFLSHKVVCPSFHCQCITLCQRMS
jgi:hypothetical protein